MQGKAFFHRLSPGAEPARSSLLLRNLIVGIRSGRNVPKPKQPTPSLPAIYPFGGSAPPRQTPAPVPRSARWWPGSTPSISPPTSVPEEESAPTLPLSPAPCARACTGKHHSRSRRASRQCVPVQRKCAPVWARAALYESRIGVREGRSWPNYSTPSTQAPRESGSTSRFSGKRRPLQRPLRADFRHHQRLLHCRQVRSPELGFHLVQLVGFHRLIVGLHQEFHGERIVFVFFQMGDRVVVFLLIHQQRTYRALP